MIGSVSKEVIITHDHNVIYLQITEITETKRGPRRKSTRVSLVGAEVRTVKDVVNNAVCGNTCATAATLNIQY